MKANKILITVLAFTAFATFCIFEGSDLMLNIGATVLIGICACIAVYMAWDAHRHHKLEDNVCPACKDGVMCALRSLNVKMCSSCGHNVPWKLKHGQLPLVANNRQVKKQ